ncbi:sensor histidine kinase [Streptomyces sp. NPDC101225]|uniref:sensor histidine kinase n=1 Tax=Streptomyces sp. NPDC101225 TaxID=3366135 RepID=UPI0038068B9E
MARRLLIILTVLMGIASLALSMPLADSYARDRTEQLLLQRRTEAVRFANLAASVVTDADRSEVSTEMRRYADLYGSGVALVDGQGHVLLQTGSSAQWSTEPAREARDRALTGRTTDRLPTIRPWGPDRVVLAEPVGGDEQLSGAVLMTVPTTAAAHDVTVRWLLIAAGALTAFAAAAGVAVWITQWLLRPVRQLDHAVDDLAQGNPGTGLGRSTGPPELRRLEQRFFVMAETVTESIRRQRDFVADASHQLRNPLATLLLQLENIEPYLVPAGRDEHALAVDEVGRLARLLDALLVLAQVESSEEDLVDLDVSGACRSRLAAWQRVYRSAGLALVDSVADGVRGRGLPSAVDRVLDAALDNAAKFVPRGGQVEVRATAGQATCRVLVRDDGPGLPADRLARMPRRFTRGPEHQNLPGSGLGLAIADEIARKSGGRLTLSGNTPHGLVIELLLPGVPPSAPPRPRGARAASRAEPFDRRPPSERTASDAQP